MPPSAPPSILTASPYPKKQQQKKNHNNLLQFCWGFVGKLIYVFCATSSFSIPPSLPVVFSGIFKVTGLHNDSSKYNPFLVCLRDNKSGSN